MYVDILRINKGSNKLMSVRQLKENKITKDGISLVFIQYSKGLDGKRHQYQSQAYMTEEEAIQTEKAGIRRIRLHDFRHSCASLLINNGANVTLVAKYLGHTKIEETLNTYSHMFSTALDSVVSVIDSLEDD